MSTLNRQMNANIIERNKKRHATVLLIAVQWHIKKDENKNFEYRKERNGNG